MKKNKKWLPALLWILAVSAALAFLYVRNGTEHEIRLAKQLGHYEGILYGIDVHDDVYYIFRTDISASTSRYIPVPRQKNGKTVTIGGIATGSSGDTYIQYTLAGGGQTQEEIRYCDFERCRLVKRWNIREITDTRFQYLLSEDGNIFLGGSVNDGDGIRVKEYCLNEGAGQWEPYRTFSFPEDTQYYILDLAGIWFLDLDGNISFLDKNGDISPAFYNDGAIIGKANGCYDVRDGILHFMNLDTGITYELMSDQTPRACEDSFQRKDIEQAVGQISQIIDYGDHLVYGAVQKDNREVPFVYGAEALVLESLKLSQRDMWLLFLFITVILSAAACLLLSVLYGLYLFNHRTFPIALLMLLVIIPMLFAGYLLSARTVERNLVSNMMEIEKEALGHIGQQFAGALDREKFSDLTSGPADSRDPYLLELLGRRYGKESGYYDFQRGESAGGGRRYFQFCYAYRHEILYSLTEGTSLTVPAKYQYSPMVCRAMEEAVNRESMVYLTQSDDSGIWMSMYLPYKNTEGDVCGILEIREDITPSLLEIAGQTKKINDGIMKWIGALLIGIVVLVSYLLRPLGNLSKRVEDMLDGKLGGQVTIRGYTEITKISRVFNRMSARIAEHFGELSDFCGQYAKFVPVKFLEYLGKKDVRSVELGDFAEREFMIVNINSGQFERDSARLTGPAMFEFINCTLGILVPMIEGYSGVVERFLNAGLVGLFDGNGKNALDAAVSALQKLEAERPATGGLRPRFTAGICLGPVRLGMIGADTRMEAAAVSEYGRLCSFLQKMTEKYGAGILITGAAAGRIPDFLTSYHVRTLGYMKIQDRLEKIYDVYDGDAGQKRIMKCRTSRLFERGVEFFTAGNFREARGLFIRVLEEDRNDLAAQNYFYLCETYLYETDQEKICLYLESC